MLGDGIRRNIATVTQEERDRFLAAILKLNDTSDPSMKYSDGRTFFQKQEWIHFAGHALAHGGAAFFGWHRELLNRVEALLRVVDPQLSLHYWDWTTDPRHQIDSDGNDFSLFTSNFMGDDGSGAINRVASDGGGDAGAPFTNFGTIVSGQTYPELGGGTPDPPADHADLPGHTVIWRAVGPSGVPATNIGGDVSATQKPVPPTPNPNTGGPLLGTVAQANVGGAVASDSDVVTAGDALPQNQQFGAFMNAMKGHNYIHQYLGGTIGTEHVASGDPFFLLFHSNVDRLWAMWQRAVVGGVPQSWRLDPNKTYGTTPLSTASFPPWDGTPGIILPSPLVPWVPGSHADDLVNDGLINSVGGLIPNHQIVAKTAKDPTVVIPPSYDTAPHSSYIIVNRDTFSNSEVAALGSPATFANAFYVVYEGFTPKELNASSTPLPNPPPNLPTFAFTGASNISAVVSPVNPVSYENPSGTIDMPQRIMISYDIKFTNANDFPVTSGGEKFVTMKASLSYDVDTGTGGSTVHLTEIASTELALVNQPNPYMIDTEPGDPSPYWLSVDTRVFQKKATETLAGVTQGDMDTDHNAPFTFIQGVVSAFNSFNPANPADPSHPFLTQLSEDETASQLELSQKVGGQRVYNYAVAKVRYLAPASVPATNVGVFFRVFSTAVSALSYDATSGATGNYRRTGNTNASSVPLLGIQNDSHGTPETACIPFFASKRVRASANDFNDGTAIASMTTQSPDSTNIQTINSCAGGGGTPPCPLNTENVAYFGAWLDINLAPGDPNYHEFPLSLSGVTGWPDGPYTGTLNSLQTLMFGTHHCMTAEIFFWPPGVVSDPIPHNASPTSSDRLAQRNLALVKSGNPGYPATHTVQHTFIVKPSVVAFDQPTTVGVDQPVRTAAVEMPGMVGMGATAKPAKRGKRPAETITEQPAAAAVRPRYQGPDELIIRWNNLPRASVATFYLPEIEVDEILALSTLRQHPTVLERVDAHTLRCRLSDVTFIPLPSRKGTLAGLVSLTLPQGVRTGQVFKFSVEQYSGFTLKTLGAFQMTIPVKPDPEILPEEIRKLAVMRYVQQAIPTSSRWHSIFVRYLNEIAARVRGFGGNPDEVKPDPAGGEGAPPVCLPHKVHEVCPADLFCLNIPWKECDVEGELDLKLRFRRKCE